MSTRTHDNNKSLHKAAISCVDISVLTSELSWCSVSEEKLKDTAAGVATEAKRLELFTDKCFILV